MTQQNTMFDPENIPLDSGEPMQKFKGRLVSITKADGPQQGNSVPMLFNFLDLDQYPDEIVSLTPWPFPQYQLRIPYASKGGRWVAFSDSIKRIPGWEARMSGELKEHVLTMEITPDHPSSRQIEGAWVQVMDEMWEVVAIDDVKGAPRAVQPVAVTGQVAQDVAVPYTGTEDELLLELANGRTEAEFTQAAYTDDRVKGTPLFQRIMAESAGVLSGLVAAGTLTLSEEGVFTKA